jgi:hypothetical protein
MHQDVATLYFDGHQQLSGRCVTGSFKYSRSVHAVTDDVHIYLQQSTDLACHENAALGTDGVEWGLTRHHI